MGTLSPLDAAKLADGVYGIREDNNVRRGVAARGVVGLDQVVKLDEAVIGTGVSGRGPITRSSGFALVMPSTTQGEMVIATRGTTTKYDWLTNSDTGTIPGPGGCPVHGGFQKVFQSIETTIDDAFRGKTPTHVHCVGHSLGGALATLVAAKVQGLGIGVSLYTFGAPRPGTLALARYLDEKLGEESTFRVFNPADVVPMVPIHPFCHAPLACDGIRVNQGGALFSVDSHYMSSYTPAVKKRTWDELKVAGRTQTLYVGIDGWLDKAAEYVRIPGAHFAMSALGHALTRLLEACKVATAGAYIVTSTLVDKVASILAAGVTISKEIADKVSRWVTLVLKFAGKVVRDATKDLTKVFLRWVLELLMRPLLAMASRAISLGTRGG